MAYKAEIPYGAYWSTPFAKWQGSLAGLHSVEFAAHVARDELAKRDIDPETIDYGVLGLTVPQRQSFYGAPWFTGMVGAPQAGGPTIMQACATSARCLLAGAQEIEDGMATKALVATCDQVSNGPQIYYPNAKGPGGTGKSENWTLDNMAADPLGGHSMLQTAENVAEKNQITTARQHEVVLRRQEQDRDALADDRAFHKRYMSLPFEVPSPNYRKTATTMDGDEGIRESSAEGLAGLRPVLPEGTVTFGGQTHPADGNACVMVTDADSAAEMSSDPGVRVRLLGFGLARVELAYMPEAPIPAARRALAAAGLEIDAIEAIKTHNPFAVNDIVFAKETGVDVMAMNNYGCSLIWGHPQAPTGLRSIIELIEELALRGGGLGLFTGCAGGDTAMAAVVSVEDR
ncbi:MAG: thiolase family protein [Alphaproteobacteria bacterium]|nr:thiolase family protein [Alphaproteobacteria bacterium]